MPYVFVGHSCFIICPNLRFCVSHENVYKLLDSIIRGGATFTSLYYQKIASFERNGNDNMAKGDFVQLLWRIMYSLDINWAKEFCCPHCGSLLDGTAIPLSENS